MKTCTIRGIGHSSGEYEVLREFGTKYAAVQPNKDRSSIPIPWKRFQKKQENHVIVNSVLDDILLNELKKVSAVNHNAPEFLENDYGENDLYLVEIYES